MDNVAQLRRDYKLIFIIIAIMGVGLFTDNSINWRLISCVSVAMMGCVSVMYTVFITRHEFILVLKCICASTQAIAGLTKLYLFIKNKKQTEALFLFISEVYEANEKATQRRKEIVALVRTKYRLMHKGLAVICVMIIVVVVAYPAYAFIHLNKIELFFENQLVGYPMSAGTTKNYVINYCAQLVEIFYAYQGNLVYDVIMSTLIFQIYLLVELLEAAFEEVEQLIENDFEALAKSINNCLIMLQDINNYILELKNIFSTVVLIQISMASTMLALSLFSIVTTDWLGGYGFAMMAFIEIMIYCLVGTFLEIMNEKLAQLIYDLKWYMLPIKQQKLICFSLMNAQLTASLTIGNIAPLNVQSGASILKMIYTYLMVLLNFTA